MQPNELDQTSAPTRAVSKPNDSLSIPIAIIFSGILVAAAILFTPKSPTQVAGAQVAGASAPVGADIVGPSFDLLKLKPDDHILGNPNADVVIIEYTDVQCSYCQRYQETMLKVMDNYGKGGQVAWVFRHFPLDSIHPYARKGAEGLECANEIGGNTAFWKLEDKMFAVGAKISDDGLAAMATAIGIDTTKFADCLSSGKWAERVQRDFEEGVNVGVKGTPYSVIWNRKTGKQMAINGAYPFEHIKAVLGLVTASAQNTN